MRKVRWAARARKDFIRITDGYADVAPHYPMRVLDGIDALMGLLSLYPDMGPELPNKRAHKFRIKGTKYILVYSATRSELLIKRVRHARENWRRER